MHKTVTCVLKIVQVDKGIVPVVQWLNSFESVVTKFSCEGNRVQKPYIMFSCDCLSDLLTIVERVGYIGHVKICPPFEVRAICYNLVFNNKRDLKFFIEGVKKQNEYATSDSM